MINPSTVLPFSSGTTKQLSGLLGLDLWDLLDDDADMILGIDRAALVIDGNVALSGSIRSKDLHGHLAAQHNDLHLPQHTIVILGDLVINGDLIVDQYHDVLVKGSVSVHALRGGSANLVAAGPIVVADVIRWLESEEGGVLYGASVTTELFIRQAYTDIEPAGSFRSVPLCDDERANSLIAAVRKHSSQDPTSALELEVWFGIDEARKAGRLHDLLMTYDQELARG